MFSPKKILVPTDFSNSSEQALAVACDIAREHHSTVRLVHVVEVVQQCVADYCIDSALVADMQAKIEGSATNMMKKLVERVAPSSDVPVTTDLRQGVPYREILSVEEAEGIDLIVIGSHGKTGILGHLGSIADKVSRAARCPVLVIKPQQTGAQGARG
jgi:nucleotide-binding universal stress UspA family protein